MPLNRIKPRRHCSGYSTLLYEPTSRVRFSIADWQFTRVILGIQILSASVTLPPKVLLKPRVYKSLLTLLGPVMLGSVLIASLAAKLYVEIAPLVR